MGVKKLAIEITFRCGKKIIKRFTTRKGVEKELKRLSKARKIYDGKQYTNDFAFRLIK